MRSLSLFKVIGIVIAIALIGSIALLVNAQDNDVMPLDFSAAVVDQLDNPRDQDVFIFTADSNEIIALNALTLKPGFQPTLAVYNGAGEKLMLMYDASGQSSEVKVIIPQPGDYRIVVETTSNAIGGYVLNARHLGYYTHTTAELPLNTPVKVATSAGTYLQRLTFPASTENALTLVIYHSVDDATLGVSLKNLDWQQEVGAMNVTVGVSAFCIPKSGEHYALDVSNILGHEWVEYTVLVTDKSTLGCENANMIDLALGEYVTPVNLEDLGVTLITDETFSDTDTSTNDDTGTGGGTEPPEVANTCGATSDKTVNVRALPSTAAPVVATLDVDESLPIVGWALDTTWAQVSLMDGNLGYISTSAIHVADVCATVNIPHVTVDENELLSLQATVSGVGGANLDVSADLSGVGASGTANLLGTEIPIEVTLEVPLDIVPTVVPLDIVPTIVPTLPPVNIPVVPTLVPTLPGLGG